jgi:carboxymethylenebutenolidase
VIFISDFREKLRRKNFWFFFFCAGVIARAGSCWKVIALLESGMGVRWNGSKEKRQEEEGWQEEEVTLVPHLRASLVAPKPGVPGDARKTNSLLQRIHFVHSATCLLRKANNFPADFHLDCRGDSGKRLGMKTLLLSSALLLCFTWQAFPDDTGISIPPGEAHAKEALNQSPRHGEWVDVRVADVKNPLRCFVVYPEIKEKAPVIILIHEIFGLTDWARAVADQLAAEGFIAIAPDLLSGKGPGGGGTESVSNRDDVVRLVRDLKQADVIAALNAVRDYAIKLPAASGKSASIGFCWGGGVSFHYAAEQPALNAAVVYYGTSPTDAAELEKIKPPVLGLYGGDDARVSSTVPSTAEQMAKLGKAYTYHLYEGAGHGFLRAQGDRNGANLQAAKQSWPAAIAFLRQNTK